MSSEEDFYSTPEVRRFVGEVSQAVCPYMFEPLAWSTVTQSVKIDSDSAESSDSCLRLLLYGMGILLRVVMRIRTNRPQIQPRMVMVAANLHTPSLNTFFSIGNFCKEVMFGV